MILLTGATGRSARALLRRLTADGRARALPRPRPARARAPSACACRSRSATSPTRRRSATRCAASKTVVHLAASARDQPRGVDRGAQRRSRPAPRPGGRARRGRALRVLLRARRDRCTRRTRFLRAKALAEQAVSESEPRPHGASRRRSSTRRGDRWITLLERLSLLPVVPISGRGRARCTSRSGPSDVADCVVAALGGADGGRRRYELAGPETLTYDEIVRTALRRASGAAAGCSHVPLPARARRRCGGREGVAGAGGVRHLGRGGADGGLDDDADTAPATPRRWASPRCRWARCSAAAGKRKGPGGCRALSGNCRSARTGSLHHAAHVGHAAAHRRRRPCPASRRRSPRW